MKRFRFPLQGLLRLRRLRERQARRELAEVLRALKEAETDCEAARCAVEQAEHQLQAVQDAAQLRWWAEALERRRDWAAEAERLRQELSQQAQVHWARFLQLRRDRQAVEQLRHKRWRLYQREIARRDQAQADELVLIRRGRYG